MCVRLILSNWITVARGWWEGDRSGEEVRKRVKRGLEAERLYCTSPFAKHEISWQRSRKGTVRHDTHEDPGEYKS